MGRNYLGRIISAEAKMTLPLPSTNHTHHRSYLLRLWQAGAGEAPALRIVLVSPHTGEKRSFASLEELVRFLEEEMEKEMGNRQ
jgi:hypothetical protein